MPFKFVGNKDRIVVAMGTGDVHIAKGYGVTEPSQAAIIFRPKPEEGAEPTNNGKQVDDFPVALTFSTPTSVDALIRMLQDFKRWQFPGASPIQPQGAKLPPLAEGEEVKFPAVHGRFIVREDAVEAFRLTVDSRRSNADWPRWMHDAWNEDHSTRGAVYPATDDVLYVNTPNEIATCIPGDWIVRLSDGTLNVWPHEVFAYFYSEAYDLRKAAENSAAELERRGVRDEPPRFSGETFEISTILDILRLPNYDQVRRCSEEIAILLPQMRAMNDLMVETTRHLMIEDGKAELAAALPNVGFEIKLPMPWKDDDGGRSESRFHHPEAPAADFALVNTLNKYSERKDDPGAKPPRGKNYVVGFLFRDQRSQVALILKDRPAWQAGKLNGVGGKIEEGETPAAAMVREFEQEAGAKIEDWRQFVALCFRNEVVYFFTADAAPDTDLSSPTSERVDWYDVADLLSRANAPKGGIETAAYPEIISNLAYLLPMAATRDNVAAAILDPS